MKDHLLLKINNLKLIKLWEFRDQNQDGMIKKEKRKEKEKKERRKERNDNADFCNLCPIIFCIIK